jgi:hypothetical protein
VLAQKRRAGMTCLIRRKNVRLVMTSSLGFSEDFLNNWIQQEQNRGHADDLTVLAPKRVAPNQ